MLYMRGRQGLHESSRALAAFSLYLDMGPERSFEKLCVAHPELNLRNLKYWSNTFGWQARVRQYDLEVAAAAAERSKQHQLEAMESRRNERLAAAKTIRKSALDGLEILTPRQLAEHAVDIVRMLDYADRTERLDYGEATDRLDVRNRTTEELIAELAAIEAAEKAYRLGISEAEDGAR